MGRPPIRVGSSEAPTTATERGRTSGSSEANDAGPADGLPPPSTDMVLSSSALRGGPRQRYGAGRAPPPAPQSAVAPDSRTISRHIGRSRAARAANSSGVLL